VTRTSIHIPRVVDGVLSKWCTAHKRYEPVTEFGLNRGAPGGLDWSCLAYGREQRAARDAGILPYVYFIDVGNRFLKIGKGSQCPKQMLHQYQSRNAEKCTLLHMETYPDDRAALDAEADWQRMFEHRNRHGEWFNIGEQYESDN
jgi:hypothetical protein